MAVKTATGAQFRQCLSIQSVIIQCNNILGKKAVDYGFLERTLEEVDHDMHTSEASTSRANLISLAPAQNPSNLKADFFESRPSSH